MQSLLHGNLLRYKYGLIVRNQDFAAKIDVKEFHALSAVNSQTPEGKMVGSMVEAYAVNHVRLSVMEE